MQAATSLTFAPMNGAGGIGAAVSKRMKSRGVAHVALAAELDVSRGTLSRWIRDDAFETWALMKVSLFLNYNFFQDLADEYRSVANGGATVAEPAAAAYGKKSTLRVVIEMDRDDEQARAIATKLVRDMDPNRKDPPTISVTE